MRVELLTDNEEGEAVQGHWFPDHDQLGSVVRYFEGDDDDEPSNAKMARRVKFFLRNEAGVPRKETLTEFFVPERWMDKGEPTQYALRLAQAHIQARLGEES